MSETEYRYVAARGAERKHWERGKSEWRIFDEWETLPAEELRKIADAMDGGRKGICVWCSGIVEPGGGAAHAQSCEKNKNVQRICELEAQLADARSEAVALRATEENLRAQLHQMTERAWKALDGASGYLQRAIAAEKRIGAMELEHSEEIGRMADDNADLRAQLAARTDATPLGWVNVSQKRPTVLAVHESKDAALLYEDDYTVRTVPVYEHPPRPVAPVTDAEIKRVMRKVDDGWRNEPIDAYFAAQVRALRPLFDRAAVAPDYQLVGACVVKDGKAIRTWSPAVSFGSQGECERLAIKFAPQDGGTAYRLYRREPITEATP